MAAELAAPPLPRPAAERGDVSALVPDSSRLSRGTPGEGAAAAALTCGSMTPKDRDVPAGDDTCQQGPPALVRKGTITALWSVIVQTTHILWLYQIDTWDVSLCNRLQVMDLHRAMFSCSAPVRAH